MINKIDDINKKQSRKRQDFTSKDLLRIAIELTYGTGVI